MPENRMRRYVLFVESYLLIHIKEQIPVLLIAEQKNEEKDQEN